MRKSTLIGAVASVVGVLIAFAMVLPASAAPPGAATNVSFGSQVCNANGTVSGTLSWNPSGQGSQWVDLAVDAGFSNYSRGGPYATTASAVNLTQLQRGVTYYARVITTVNGATLISDTAPVTASTCTGGGGGVGPITAPTNLRAIPISNGTVQFSWTPGDNNTWYCLDTAYSLSDLYNLSNSWRNHGCWTTSSQLTVNGLDCGQVYYWLVYAWNPTSNIKSDAAVVQTSSCQSTISAPTGLNATQQGNDTALFDWSPGTGNIWYCVDTALSRSDLLNLANSWRNHGCWTTDSQLQVSDLKCDTTYYWLVYAWNYNANVKSNVATFHTEDCQQQSHLEKAPIVDVNVVQNDNGNYQADITAALPNGCHSPASYQVERSGHTVNITVWNNVVPGPCTYIYSEYELHVNLGSNFTDGQTYQVVVNNDESDSFTANTD